MITITKEVKKGTIFQRQESGVRTTKIDLSTGKKLTLLVNLNNYNGCDFDAIGGPPDPAQGMSGIKTANVACHMWTILTFKGTEVSGPENKEVVDEFPSGVFDIHKEAVRRVFKNARDISSATRKRKL